MQRSDTLDTWESGNRPGKSVCQQCHSPVSRQFRRVFGDNENRVWACLECTTATRVKRGAGRSPEDTGEPIPSS